VLPDGSGQRGCYLSIIGRSNSVSSTLASSASAAASAKNVPKAASIKELASITAITFCGRLVIRDTLRLEPAVRANQYFLTRSTRPSRQR